MFTIISFYTKEWQYKKYADELKASCEQFGLPHIIEELPSTGRYMDNTKLKPAFIRKCLGRVKSPVVWIDCDSHLLSPPDFFNTIPDSVIMGARRKPNNNLLRFYAAVLWFRYCPESIDFIDSWMDEQRGHAGGDHSAMERAWRASPVETIELPDDYGVVLSRNQQPRGTIALRISDWPARNKELAALKKPV